MNRCSICGNIPLECNFYKDISKRDGLKPICKVCRIGDYNEKHEQKIEYQKFYAKQNRAKKNLYEKNKGKTNLNFKLACNLGSRTKKAFKSQMLKNSTKLLI